MCYYEIDVVKPGETEEQRRKRLQMKHEEKMVRFHKEERRRKVREYLQKAWRLIVKTAVKAFWYIFAAIAAVLINKLLSGWI